jgi:hypothetical protein
MLKASKYAENTEIRDTEIDAAVVKTKEDAQ